MCWALGQVLGTPSRISCFREEEQTERDNGSTKGRGIVDLTGPPVHAGTPRPYTQSRRLSERDPGVPGDHGACGHRAGSHAEAVGKADGAPGR